MYQGVGEKGAVKVDEAKDPKEYQKSAKWEMENNWKEKQRQRQYVRDMTGREWIGRRYGSSYARGTLRDVQKLWSAPHKNKLYHVHGHIDKTWESPMCRMCGEKGESVRHLTSECSTLAQREYKRWHDSVARYVHWQLYGKAELERADQWYKHTPQQVVENTGFKVLWDFSVQCRGRSRRRVEGVGIFQTCLATHVYPFFIPKLIL